MPPLGMQAATLNFTEINPYPMASTCGQILTLPSFYDEYEAFKDNFVFGVVNHGGFGLE